MEHPNTKLCRDVSPHKQKMSYLALNRELRELSYDILDVFFNSGRYFVVCGIT